MRKHRSAALATALMVAVALVVATPAVSLSSQGDCAQPLSSGPEPTATDCSYVLKAAVGAMPCDVCVCDVNGNASTSTSDALICLKSAVGQSVTLNCPPCASDTTTTTVDSGSEPSTTSTSTSSTTTTMPVHCTGNGDCSSLGEEFRCNPNNDTCEKPCTRNTQCHLFYECNKTTGYCEEPALLF